MALVTAASRRIGAVLAKAAAQAGHDVVVHYRSDAQGAQAVVQAIEAMGLKQTQMFATLFDGMTRHSPEGINFKARAEARGWKQAVAERDADTFDWTLNRPINPPG